MTTGIPQVTINCQALKCRSTEVDLQRLADTARLCESEDRDGKLQQLVTVMYFETINYFYYYCESGDRDGKRDAISSENIGEWEEFCGKQFEGVLREAVIYVLAEFVR